MRITRLLLSKYEFRFFKRYIEQEMLQDHLRSTWQPISGWKESGRKRKWYYDENRPWTEGFKRNNAPNDSKKPVNIIPIKDWTIFKGDRVEILVGKDKGKQGIINSVIKERNWCFVEGLNCEFKTVRDRSNMPPVCRREERPLLADKQVQLVDPSDDKPCEVEWRYTEEGEKVRVAMHSGRIIPLPAQAKQTEDFVLPSQYVDSRKDTSESTLTKVTFVPKIMTFDQEIMQSMGISENRKKAQTYWY